MQKDQALHHLAGCFECARRCIWNGNVSAIKQESGPLYGCNKDSIQLEVEDLVRKGQVLTHAHLAGRR